MRVAGRLKIPESHLQEESPSLSCHLQSTLTCTLIARALMSIERQIKVLIFLPQHSGLLKCSLNVARAHITLETTAVNQRNIWMTPRRPGVYIKAASTNNFREAMSETVHGQQRELNGTKGGHLQ